MRNTSITRRLTLAAAALLIAPALLRADVAAPEPIPDRVARAKCVVLGKVLRIEDKPVLALPYPGATEKVEYLIAVVQVEEGLAGADGLTHVRVGFQPPGKRRYMPPLAAGQTTCLFLSPHGDGPFFVRAAYYDAIFKTEATFDKDLAEARRCVRLLAKPEEALRSKDAEERLLTAAMLIIRYRTPPSLLTNKPRTEAIPAEQSQQILLALAEADWSTETATRWTGLAPLRLFGRLGLTEKDGWKPPMTLPDVAEAAKAWLKANAATYRIQRFVPEK